MRLLLLAGLAGLCLSSCDSGIAAHPPGSTGPFLGAITLTSAPAQFSAQANFTTAQFAPSAACAGQQVGACCVTTQPQLSIADGDAAPSTFGAGTISIADGSQPLASLPFIGFGYHPLSSADVPQLQWAPGDTLTVAASGGTAAGFTAQIATPPAFEGVAPALSPLGIVPISLSGDFTVTWTPPAGASGDVTLDLFDVNGVYVTCAAPDAAGSATVPASLFGGFTAGDDGIVTLSRARSATAQAGNDTATVTAVAAATGNLTFLP